MNKQLLKALGYAKEVHDVEVGRCPFCKNPVSLHDFRDALSVKEFKISGICQKCQDEFFGGGES